MRITVGVDNVVRATIEFLHDLFKLSNPAFDEPFQEIEEWDLRKFDKDSTVLTLFFKNCTASRVFTNANAPEIPMAKETIAALRKDGHQIVFATHQNPGNEGHTLEWLRNHGFEYDALFFGENKSLVDADVIIDDRVETLQSFHKKNGTLAICFDQPWNRDWKGERVQTWQDVPELIKRHQKASQRPCPSWPEREAWIDFEIYGRG